MKPPRWKPGRLYMCPACRRRKFEGRTDLMHVEIELGVTRQIYNNRGARCQSCHAQMLDPWDWAEIRRLSLDRLRSTVPTKVVRGRLGRLAMLWPNELLEHFPLRQGDRLRMTQLGPKEFLVQRLVPEQRHP